MSHIKAIISELEKERCVLVIGPDLVDFGDKSFFDALCDELHADNEYHKLVDITPAYVFSHEELFQLKNPNKGFAMLSYLERFYERQSQFDEPMRKISQMPFHLIVSLLPDNRLRDIFEQQKYPFQYGYCPLNENPDAVEAPTREIPLLYNLLGNFDKTEAIITFDDLFGYLKGVMGERPLPKELLKAFKEAWTFIFLGVRFERWYVQLLLRLMSAAERKRQYSILRDKAGGDVYTFFATRLNLEFIDTDPMEFLGQLYDECGKRNLLKKVARVFLSYSHEDKDVADRVRDSLRASGIEVIMDSHSMMGGEKIGNFIRTIKDVSCMLCIISKNSLRSTWVSQEIIAALQHPHVYFLPCHIDDTFLDEGFQEEVGKEVDESLRQIAGQVSGRGRGNTDDLDSSRRDLSDHINHLPRILDELRRRSCPSLKAEEHDRTMRQVVADILKNKL